MNEEGQRIFAFKKRYGSGFGKPGFPESAESYDISDYLGPDSIGFFTTLGLDYSFIENPVEEWETMESYQRALFCVKNLSVVNDGAERAVKLTSDFNATAKIEEKFQDILQVVELDRKMIPNQRKKHVRKIQIK